MYRRLSKHISRNVSTLTAALTVLAAPVFSQSVQAEVQPVIRYGNKGPWVSQAETALSRLGYYHGPIDGVFGPELLGAVKMFQAQVGLTQDGVIGPLTWDRLDRASSPISSGNTVTTSTSPVFDSSNPVLRFGDQGSLVVKLQTLLNAAGFPVTADGNFGPLTYAAVRSFQASHGLAVDGVAGPDTFSALEHMGSSSITAAPAPEASPGYLREGSTGPEVAKLQQELTNEGYSTQGIDGIFGPHTLDQVLAFQKAHGLSADGLVGPETWQALSTVQNTSNSPAPSAEVNRGNASSSGLALAGYALKFRGYRYSYGGSSPATGFDCSGLTQYIYRQFGVGLPRTSYDQWTTGRHVSYDQLQPGDLVFFTTDGIFANHVGIYLGDGEFISAATPSQGVIVQNMNEPYWAHAFVGATQVLP